MATQASINKKRARELAAITEKMTLLSKRFAKTEKKLDDILAILDPGENPPVKPNAKPRTKKA